MGADDNPGEKPRIFSITKQPGVVGSRTLLWCEEESPRREWAPETPRREKKLKRGLTGKLRPSVEGKTSRREFRNKFRPTKD